MTTRNGYKRLQTWVPIVMAEKFEAQARVSVGSSSLALCQLIADTTAGEKIAPRGTGTCPQVCVRFRDDEREALAEAARIRGTTPANWLRSLALVHLMKRPQWNGAELEALRELARQIQAIGNHLNQIARALNVAVQSGVYPPHQGGAAREGAVLVRHEMRRVAAIVTGNQDYWGLAHEEQLTAATGAIGRAKAETEAAEKQRRLRPRRRPARFAD